MVARISPARPPFAAEIQARLDHIMPKGMPPLMLFTSLARDKRLFERFMAGGLLDRGRLTLRQREIVVDRTTALSGSEYEWGVHIAFFAARAGLTATQIRATTTEKGDDHTWTDEERALIRACDQLHRSCDLDDGTWRDLRSHFADEAILEVLMLAGYYRSVSYLTNALRLPLETYARAFPSDADYPVAQRKAPIAPRAEAGDRARLSRWGKWPIIASTLRARSEPPRA